MSRFLSLIVAGIYLMVPVIAYVIGEPDALFGLLVIGAFLILPMACIWFGAEFGEWTGHAGHGQVTSTSPGWAVALLGWIILFLPVVALILNVAVKQELTVANLVHAFSNLWNE